MRLLGRSKPNEMAGIRTEGGSKGTLARVAHWGRRTLFGAVGVPSMGAGISEVLGPRVSRRERRGVTR